MQKAMKQSELKLEAAPVQAFCMLTPTLGPLSFSRKARGPFFPDRRSGTSRLGPFHRRTTPLHGTRPRVRRYNRACKSACFPFCVSAEMRKPADIPLSRPRTVHPQVIGHVPTITPVWVSVVGAEHQRDVAIGRWATSAPCALRCAPRRQSPREGFLWRDRSFVRSILHEGFKVGANGVAEAPETDKPRMGSVTEG